MSTRRINRARIRYNRLRRSIWWLANRSGGKPGEMLRRIYPRYCGDPELIELITERYGKRRRPFFCIAPRGALLFQEQDHQPPEPSVVKGPEIEAPA